MNYTGSMKDCGKGAMDMDKKVQSLLPGFSSSTMGSAYYTTPSQVANPGILCTFAVMIDS